jgi:hypothetical protein
LYSFITSDNSKRYLGQESNTLEKLELPANACWSGYEGIGVFITYRQKDLSASRPLETLLPLEL